MRILLGTVALAALTASPALAQIGNPAGMTAGTRLAEPGTAAPHQPNAQDRLFVDLLGTGGMAEVDAARMTDAKASSSAVKALARQLADDHSKSNAELARLAQPANVPMPRDLDPDHRAMRARLERMSGAQFDVGWLQEQLVEHQKTVQILEWEIASGQDGDLQRFASATLPTVLHHLEMIQQLIGATTGAGPQGLASSMPATSENAPR